MDDIKINPDELIPFVNMVNEVCCIVDHDFVGEWLVTHHNFLNQTPLAEFNKNGVDKVLSLLTLIERDEADVID